MTISNGTHRVQPVTEETVQAIVRLQELLAAQFGCDYSIQIVGRGHFVASNAAGANVTPVSHEAIKKLIKKLPA